MRANNLTLLTDLYELTMMQGYFKNPTNQTVIFDMFYRTNPCGGAFAITAGLEQMIEYIENLHFTDEDIEYLRSLNTFDEDFLEYLSNFQFTGDIYAIPEGTVVFPREPLVKVVAPIMEAQLVETAILNIINHQSLIATKAARVCYAAKGDAIMEFGLRRAQGPDAGIFRCPRRSHRRMCRYFLCTHRQNVRCAGTRNSCPQLDHELPGRVYRIQNLCKTLSERLHLTGRHLRCSEIRCSECHPSIRRNARRRYPAYTIRHPYRQW